jgi:aspartate ammonia-lyase
VAEFIRALALVKQAAARTNWELGLLDEAQAKLIIAAAREIASGALRDQFVVDVIQGGAGTSTNMNANEVIANRALELGGRQKGDYAYLHPIEHVNVAQSTNDVYPTALKIAARFAIVDLIAAMEELKQAFAAKSRSSATS